MVISLGMLHVLWEIWTGSNQDRSREFDCKVYLKAASWTPADVSLSLIRNIRFTPSFSFTYSNIHLFTLIYIWKLHPVISFCSLHWHAHGMRLDAHDKRCGTKIRRPVLVKEITFSTYLSEKKYTSLQERPSLKISDARRYLHVGFQSVSSQATIS